MVYIGHRSKLSNNASYKQSKDALLYSYYELFIGIVQWEALEIYFEIFGRAILNFELKETSLLVLHPKLKSYGILCRDSTLAVPT